MIHLHLLMLLKDKAFIWSFYTHHLVALIFAFQLIDVDSYTR